MKNALLNKVVQAVQNRNSIEMKYDLPPPRVAYHFQLSLRETANAAIHTFSMVFSPGHSYFI